jgi:GTPase
MRRSYSPGETAATDAPSSVPFASRNRLDVAIVGLPNAGKSQLLNVLTDSPVSAVSRKRHTTRTGVLGVRTLLPPTLSAKATDASRLETPTQLVFCDTPGFMRGSDSVGRDLQMSVSSHMQNVDTTVLVVDAARRLDQASLETLLALLLHAYQSKGRIEINTEAETTESTKLQPTRALSDQRLNSKLSIVLNKVDLVHPKTRLLETAERISDIVEETVRQYWSMTRSNTVLDETTIYEDCMPTFYYTSALKNKGVDALLQGLVEMSTPCAAWEVEDWTQSTNMTPEERAKEMIREKVYRCLHKEVPYQIHIATRLFRVGQMRTAKSAATSSPTLGLHLEYDLVVHTASHRELVNGRNGQTLEAIRHTAERDLAKMFECPVRLGLFVKLSKSKSRVWNI